MTKQLNFPEIYSGYMLNKTRVDEVTNYNEKGLKYSLSRLNWHIGGVI